MPTPSDQQLYERVKRAIYLKYPTHSAYRSGMLVKEYKRQFKILYPNRNPYKGEKHKKEGLTRWFAEEWRNQRGEVGYTYQSDVYRPTRRVSPKTPLTFREISKERIQAARREKTLTGRVKKF